MLNPKLCRWIGFGRDRDLAIVLQQFKWKKKNKLITYDYAL